MRICVFALEHATVVTEWLICSSPENHFQNYIGRCRHSGQSHNWPTTVLDKICTACTKLIWQFCYQLGVFPEPKAFGGRKTLLGEASPFLLGRGSEGRCQLPQRGSGRNGDHSDVLHATFCTQNGLSWHYKSVQTLLIDSVHLDGDTGVKFPSMRCPD